MKNINADNIVASSGVVAIPSGVGFAAYRKTNASTQAFTAGSTTTISFAESRSDEESLVTNPGTTWTYTAPRTGWYRVTVNLVLSNYTVASATTSYARLEVSQSGGVQYPIEMVWPGATATNLTAPWTLAGSVEFPMNAGSTFVIRVVNVGIGATIQAGNTTGNPATVSVMQIR